MVSAGHERDSVIDPQRTHMYSHGCSCGGTGAAFDLPEAVANEVLAQKEELATRHFVVDAPHSLPMDPSDDGGYMPSRGGRRGGGGGGGFRRGGGGGGYSRGGGGGYSENSYCCIFSLFLVGVAPSIFFWCSLRPCSPGCGQSADHMGTVQSHGCTEVHQHEIIAGSLHHSSSC